MTTLTKISLLTSQCEDIIYTLFSHLLYTAKTEEDFKIDTAPNLRVYGFIEVKITLQSF